MCKLLIAISNTEDNKEFQKVVRTQFKDLSNQPNGIGATVMLHNDPKLYIFRDYVNYDEIFAKVDALLPKAKLVGLHTRISTSGSLGIGNVHFFERDGYLLAHNGTIPKFYGYWNRKGYLNTDKSTAVAVNDDDYFAETLQAEMEDCMGCTLAKKGICKTHANQKEIFGIKDNKPNVESKDLTPATTLPSVVPDPCDSLQFLEKLPKPVTSENLAEFVEETSMNGMMVVIERATGKIFMVVKKEVFAISDKKTFGAFFSYKPETEFKKDEWLWLYDVPVFDKVIRTKLNYVPRKVAQGTFELNY